MTSRMRRGFLLLGIGLGLLTLALDQLSKFYIFNVLRLPERGPIELLPILELTFVWNHGISLGLLQQGSAFGHWALVALELAAVLFILLWMSRTRSHATVIALGLIAGGALGNALDRAVFGAVQDFLHLHGGTVRWLDFPYVFNVADAAISLGVTVLILESLFARAAPATEALERHGDSR